MKRITRRRFLTLAGGAGAFGLLSSYPLFIERSIVLTNTYRIPVPNLPAAFSGFRIVHLTDLHYGPLTSLAHLRSVIAGANRIKRDLVVCTGDYVRGRMTTGPIDAVWPILADLEAPMGVFSVLGNHDHWADTARSQYWLERTGQDLRHKVIGLERNGTRLWLAGAGDLWEDHENLDRMLHKIPAADCRIVLAHNPDTADTDFTARVDLMISGHTHGGQVRIPFIGAPILPVRNKNYSSGLKSSPRGLSVFISRGIGWAILPIRFNCLPELAVLELVPARPPS
jgi:predicted MPP superfamily phosphohydrolase